MFCFFIKSKKIQGFPTLWERRGTIRTGSTQVMSSREAALTGKPDSLLGLLVSQTMVVRKTRKTKVVNLVLGNLWLKAEFVINEGNYLLAKNGFHWKRVQRKSAALENHEERQVKGEYISPKISATQTKPRCLLSIN